MYIDDDDDDDDEDEDDDLHLEEQPNSIECVESELEDCSHQSTDSTEGSEVDDDESAESEEVDDDESAESEEVDDDDCQQLALELGALRTLMQAIILHTKDLQVVQDLSGKMHRLEVLIDILNEQEYVPELKSIAAARYRDASHESIHLKLRVEQALKAEADLQITVRRHIRSYNLVSLYEMRI